MANNSPYEKTSRYKEEKLSHRLQDLIQYHKTLEPSPSILWFNERFSNLELDRLWSKWREDDFNDKYNSICHNVFVPDVVNHGYKYIIEVLDGQARSTFRSRKAAHMMRHYKVFQVKAFSEESYSSFIKDYTDYIQQMNNTKLAFLINKLDPSFHCEHKSIKESRKYRGTVEYKSKRTAPTRNVILRKANVPS